ncbi:nuclear transport factor 2 family protein [Bradyrhizobium sp. 159]|uniref:nuclear transport factor 2 family protein n=1 Tax=Bradyrhizobium sp. 159 TaxID=2782632 RepID=UPI001FF78148|nr:nuclear transport factor 2 family protein [Bradyrhizobium sp. 159]
MYADDAVVHFRCGGAAISGRTALREFWVDRFRRYPASELEILEPSGVGILIAYRVPAGLASAIMIFDADGKIVSVICSPIATK